MNRAFFPNENAFNSASSLLLPSKQPATSNPTLKLETGGGLSASHPVRGFRFLSFFFFTAENKTTIVFIDRQGVFIPLFPLNLPNDEF